jgi:hypothetical protein
MLSIVWTVSVGFLGKNFPSKGAEETGRLSALPFVGVCQVSLFAFICLHKDWERRGSAVPKEFFGVTYRKILEHQSKSQIGQRIRPAAG